MLNGFLAKSQFSKNGQHCPITASHSIVNSQLDIQPRLIILNRARLLKRSTKFAAVKPRTCIRACSPKEKRSFVS
jgi:hypothetical protein